MALTDDDIQGIADLSRFAARASSREAIVRETFKTMKGLARIESLRVVYPYDHSGWEDWRVSGKGISMKRVDEWRDPASNSATANFDPDTPESGYISANPKSAKAGLLMPVLAPAVHTSMLLQSALARVQKRTAPKPKWSRRLCEHAMRNDEGFRVNYTTISDSPWRH